MMWTSKELAFVKEHLGKMSATEIGRRLGKSRNPTPIVWTPYVPFTVRVGRTRMWLTS
jgi:hypothetical protein